jgi:hypothetical protein
MQSVAEPILQDLKAECCSRCLQPVPVEAPRCPRCGQPIGSKRVLPLAIGVAGLLALVFAVFLMYRMVSNEDAAKAPPPPDPAATQQQLFPDPPPANSKASEPARPEKRPPLDER